MGYPHSEVKITDSLIGSIAKLSVAGIQGVEPQS